MEPQDQNIYVIRSVWRRLKEGHVKVRDLQPVKDVKGGGGATANLNSLQAAPASCVATNTGPATWIGAHEQQLI